MNEQTAGSAARSAGHASDAESSTGRPATSQASPNGPRDGASSTEELRNGFVAMVEAFHHSHPARPEGMRGLSVAEFRVLMMAIRAEEKGGALRPSDIARAGRITPSAVSQVLKGLEERGYVTRVRAEGDSRAVNIVLTDEGKALSRDMANDRAQMIDGIIAHVGEDEMRQFLATWKKVIEFQQESGAFVSRDEAFDGPPMPPPEPFGACPACCTPAEGAGGCREEGGAR